MDRKLTYVQIKTDFVSKALISKTHRNVSLTLNFLNASVSVANQKSLYVHLESCSCSQFKFATVNCSAGGH